MESNERKGEKLMPEWIVIVTPFLICWGGAWLLWKKDISGIRSDYEKRQTKN